MADTKGCDICLAHNVLAPATLSVHIKAEGKGADLFSKEGKKVDLCSFHHSLSITDLTFEGTWKNLPMPEGTS